MEKQKKHNGFYLMADYPDRGRFFEAAVKGLEFFDFLEVGFPFSDPVADGPRIAAAGMKSIKNGITLEETLKSISALSQSVPKSKKIYLMTYANHVYSRGSKLFARLAADAGLSGLIIPDLPYVEAGLFKEDLNRRGLDVIHFITPENSLKQIKEIALQARGFLYAVSMRGITGGNTLLNQDIITRLKLARQHSRVPVVLGFGIRTPELARLALEAADGFITGTRMVELIEEETMEGFAAFINELQRLRV